MKTLKQCTTLDECAHYIWQQSDENDKPSSTDIDMALQRAHQLGWNEAIEAAQQAVRETDVKFVHLINENIRALKRPTQEKGE
jgi:hypothetical protein